jgi:uncharacterized protein DUF6941
MPRLRFAVCCQSSSIDSRTNNISLFHILEQIQFQGFPGVFPFVEIVSFWEREADQLEAFTQRVRLLNPQGHLIGEHETAVLMELPGNRVFEQIQGVPFPQAGTYTFEISLRRERDEQWSVVAQIPLIVQQRVQPATR